MENTCNEKNCKFHELIGGDPEQCPNFVESWWTPKDGGQPRLVRDCAPKRTMLMVQEHYNRLIGLQEAQEQQRNESAKIIRIFNSALQLSSGKRPAFAARSLLSEGDPPWR